MGLRTPDRVLLQQRGDGAAQQIHSTQPHGRPHAQSPADGQLSTKGGAGLSKNPGLTPVEPGATCRGAQKTPFANRTQAQAEACISPNDLSCYVSALPAELRDREAHGKRRKPSQAPSPR